MPISRRAFLAASAVAGLAARDTLADPRAPILGAVGPPEHPAVDRFDPWVEVDGGALVHNLEQVRRLAGGRPVLAVVKNDAYGLGLTTASRLLERTDGIAGFAVVRTAEATTLRDAGVRKPILLMARVAEPDVRELLARDVELAVFADDDVRRLTAPGVAAAGSRLPVQFYIDSGMGRMGLPYRRALVLVREAARSGAFDVRGTFTELAEDAAFDPVQLDNFASLLAEAKQAGVSMGRVHAASSNGVFHLPQAHLDLVRPGIALYGGYPSRPDEERARAELRPAVRLCARVVRVERLHPGDSVSYGRTYIADRPVWTATLPVGHADGYPRKAVAGARVLVGGKLYPVVGAVSASHCIIEVGDEPTVRIGDIATFIGPDDPAIHPNALADAIGVSVYDLFMHLNPSLPRFVV